ncbi:MAG: DUF924 family protein [Sphingomonadaceae bacterium]
MSGVSKEAEAVLRFWLEETPAEKRFAVDPRLDAEIGARFRTLMDDVAASRAAGWRDDPRTMLAAIILTDQFPRNLFRGTPEAFATDGLARELTNIALDKGWDVGLSPIERQFLYMPLMHSEDLADQHRSVELYNGLGLAEPADFARRHRDQIARFGRLPGRNAALGRVDTPEEAEFLKEPGAHF